MKTVKKYAFWIVFGVISGAICGLCGVIFSKSVGFAADLRTQNSWTLFLLPFAGLASVGIYKLFKVQNIGTTNVFDCVRTEQNLPRLLAPAVFCGTCISHLFGASNGREGAALQIGGGVANTLTRLFKLDEDARHITVMCGMSALFSAVFGTPLAACIFVLEVIMTRLCVVAVIPVLCSSITAFTISQLLNVHPERFNIGKLPSFSFSLVWKTAVISVAGIIVSFIFCKGIDVAKKMTKKFLKNEFIRIAVGGTTIVVFTLLVHTRDYNGGGIDVIERVFEGSVRYEAFALKMLFTIICVSCGYKGGEIIPTLFIGATLGGTLGVLLNLPIATAAAVGIAVLFCSATKCPIATILLCAEMFGYSSILLIAPTVIVSFVFSHRLIGLYSNSKDLYNIIKRYLKKA